MMVCRHVLLCSLLGSGCFYDPASTTPSASSTSDGTSTSTTAESAAPADSAGSSTDADASSSGTTDLENGSSSSTGNAEEGSSSTGGTEVTFDLYEELCTASWEVTDGVDAQDGACGLSPMDANELGGAWRFPSLMTMQGEQALAIVLQPYPLTGGTVEGSFSAADVPHEDGNVLELEYAFVNVVPGATSVGTMTLQLFVRRPDDVTVDFVTEEAQGDATTGTLSMPLGDVILGPGDDVVFQVRSDDYVEGQAVALLNARVIAET